MARKRGEQEEAQFSAQSPSLCPSGGAPSLRGPNVNATARRSPQQQNAPRREDVRPIGRVHPEQRQDGPAHCAARRAHPHSPAARPPLVWVRPGAALRKGVPGDRRTPHPYARRPRLRRKGEVHRTSVRRSSLQERYPLRQCKEGQVGHRYGGRRPDRAADQSNTSPT